MIAAFYDPVDCDSIAQIERGCGINPEYRMFPSIYQASFTSAIWVTDGTHLGFVPKPGRLLARLWWTVKMPSEKMLSRHMNAIALGLWPSCNSLPIIKVWLAKAFTGESIIDVGKDWWRDFGTVEQRFDLGIYHHFAERYGLSVEELFDCEEYLMRLPMMSAFISHPVLYRMVQVDLADVLVRDIPVLSVPEDTLGKVSFRL